VGLYVRPHELIGTGLETTAAARPLDVKRAVERLEELSEAHLERSA
jgi:hypothetical protein